MKLKFLAFFCCTYFVSSSLIAGIMREDVSVQDYRDFAENLGKYAIGKENIEVFKTDGSSAGILKFPMPDLGSISRNGFSTVLAPSYVVSVRHNPTYKTVDFGNGAQFRTFYTLINRNDHETADFHIPRVNKVITEAPSVPYISSYDLSDTRRYTMFARAGGGRQKQVNAETQEFVTLSQAYAWKTGGSFTDPKLGGYKIIWSNYRPDDPRVQPLDIGTEGGDSGSPVFVYDNLEKEWKLVAVDVAGGSSSPYGKTGYAFGMQMDFIDEILARNTDPDITDLKADGTIHWSKAALTQGSNSWAWHGVDKTLPTNASNAELDASKDLRFNGEGGTLVLDQSVNLGAGKLQFSNDYQVRSAEGENSTWVGGGIEVDRDKTVLWQVNGLAGDALHKIGQGTLHVNATGVNGGSLNVGDGTVILDQQADQHGQKQAFSTVTLVSGRPVVVLADKDQVATDNIQFGYRGGTLDTNGNDLSFSAIKHNDNGATLVNRNRDATSLLTLTGNGFNFLGHLGETDSGNLDLSFDAAGNSDRSTLSGGGDLQHLDVKRGELVLSGQQTLHAGGVYFSNDWDEQAYQADSVTVHAGNALTVSDHASLNTAATVAEAATLNLYAHALLSGSVRLTEADSLLKADITERSSTVAGLSSTISADISGKGKLIKTGEGGLQVDGDITTTGDTELLAGTLVLNGNVSSPVNMHSDAVLGGSGRLQTLNAADQSKIYPGALLSTDADYGTLRLGTLNTTGAVTLALNSAFSNSATDKLLVEGDVNGDEPVMVSVNGRNLWADSDSNQNGAADNNEGVSVIQVGGNSTSDRFKLAGDYVARGAWAYGLYAFAPGKSAESEREVSGTAGRYWDYRLQNILLAEGDNTLPSAPEEHAELTPEDPATTPEETVEKRDTAAGEKAKQPQPAAIRPVRRAVIPQVPAYISLPSALFRAEEQRTALFKESAQDAAREENSGFFLFGYRGDEHYKSGNDFLQYGYNSKSRYKGWTMGANMASWQNDRHSLSLSGAVSKGDLSFTPSAADGYSRGNFRTNALNLMLAWHYEDYYLNLLTGYGWSKGDISTHLRGNVASPKVKQIMGEIEGGKSFNFGAHQIRPYASHRQQQLHVNSFTDVDNAHVRYQQQRRKTWTGGLAYDYSLPLNTLGKLRLGSDVSLATRPSGQGKVMIGDAGQGSAFHTGNGGNSLNIKTEARLELNNNMALTTRIHHQRKLQQEGANDLLLAGGIDVTF